MVHADGQRGIAVTTDVIQLEFSTSLTWQSLVIRKCCHSPFSHVDLVHERGLLGASDPGGVALRPFNYQKFGIRRRATIATPLASRIMELVLSQVGKPFDGEALIAFMEDTPRDWRTPDKWFCSELIVWAFEEAGFFCYKLVVPKNRVSPADLLLILNPAIDADKFHLPLPLKWEG